MVQEKIVNSISKILEEFSDEFTRDLENFSVMTLEDMTEYVRERTSFFIEPNNLTDALRYAWGYEEAHRKEYSLEDAIAWFKSNAPKKKNRDEIEGCLLLEKKRHGPYLLHHCFVCNHAPLLDGKNPHRLVKSLSITQDLIDRFGNQNMLIMR